jgi:hypothetical protein
VINATVLEDWEEANLADPKILERFVRAAIDRYPADRYILYTFAHSQGIIDTRTFSIKRKMKNVSISNDDTSKQKMDLKQFHDAIKCGLDGRQFDLIIFFSCLTNMVEIGYAFSDITHYFIAIQDEIRLLNEPSEGMSIYLSNPLIPDNIYKAHQCMYSRSRFSQDTQWDEMIACFRHRLK